MKIYNTLTRKVEEIVPIEPGKIKMYSCGPTVYRYIHIGNLRTFTMADWIRRAFEYRGYEVLHVKNITDVGHMRQELVDRGEDKILAQARKEGKTSAQIARFYTEAFHEDERKLNIEPATIFPRATQHIPEMIEIIRGLQEKGVAYEVNGNVYFDIKRFPDYGKLSGNQLENMLAGVREGVVADRRNPEDFPLWKVAEPGREMAWDSPWGRGFPGWHIECSAMSMKYLGPHFDIHTGGVDNIFPHHEDEIAQSEGYTGEPFANYWVHAQHLLADGQKMAKSTGNAYTCSEIEARGFDPMSLRYFYTTALYRSRLNFTFRALQAAQISLERLRDHAYRLYTQADQSAVAAIKQALQSAGKEGAIPQEALVGSWQEAFLAEVEHDLNIPRAMAVVWEMLHDGELDPTTKVALLLDFDRILGFDLNGYLQSDRPRRKADVQTYRAAVPADIAEKVREREALRNRGEYAQADSLRGAIEAAGYTIRDTGHGSLVRPRRLEDEFTVLSSSGDAPNNTHAPDRYEFSVNLLAHNSRDDLERCISSICRHTYNRSIELVIVDNGSTDETLPYLQALARHRDLRGENGQPVGLQVLFADHNMGFAAGRNATMRASRGHYIVLIDTSIEVKGNIWEPLAMTLADRNMGVVGPYGLVTEDLREFAEAAGPDVDAVEGYLMAFRRELLAEVGWIDERFRFYRLMDIYYSFFFKTSGYRVLAVPEVAERIEKHPHREWFSLSEEERATKSKKNYDIFRDRWHHGQSLLVANYHPENLWRGHDHPYHLEGTHNHSPDELPPAGTMHTHTHQHWPDHSHEHPHYHEIRQP
ncbi:MAG TPA: cysteine--tRNA ligase [Ktedonobacteraceae bacterium]|jgi:cysteinyl-tRNA synthetase|nr:cysteine--tRNA ligase [Ktedonobacteraceae bacterium]